MVETKRKAMIRLGCGVDVLLYYCELEQTVNSGRQWAIVWVSCGVVEW